VNQSKHTVESGGAIYTNPSALIRFGSRISCAVLVENRAVGGDFRHHRERPTLASCFSYALVLSVAGVRRSPRPEHGPMFARHNAPMRLLTLLLSVAAGLGAHAIQAAPSAAQPRDAATLYAQFCAGCHGADLRGNRAGSLIDQKWVNASDDAGLRRVIRNGVPRSGMPSFSRTFSEPEIRSLVILIREAAHRDGDPAIREAYDLPDDVQLSEGHTYRVEKVITNLDVPWALAFLPDGRLLFTQRKGTLTLATLKKGRWTTRTILGTPPVWVRDEGGLLGITPHPDYATNGWLYLTLSDRGPNDSGNTKLVRGRIQGNRWVDQETIYQAPIESYSNKGINFGSRVAFHDNHLFFSFGERGEVGQAQNLSLPNGKVHRLLPDGSIPPDNPFVNKKNALSSIWSYGHRNPQGIAIHPLTGELWETEHGPRGGDELNYIRRGRNYGWPAITYGMNYDGTPVSALTKKNGMEQPVLHWMPSIAVSPIHFYVGDAFPRWKNQLFLGALAQQELHRMEVEGDRIVHRELILKGKGRVRDIITGPDGYLYVALEIPGPDTPDHIIRLVPADAS